MKRCPSVSTNIYTRHTHIHESLSRRRLWLTIAAVTIGFIVPVAGILAFGKRAT